MKLNKRLATVFILVGLLIGGLLGGIVLAGRPQAANAAQSSQGCVDDDALEGEKEVEDDDAAEVGEQDDAAEGEEEDCDDDDEGEADEGDEADEVAPANTGITADEARSIAEEAYPDAAVLAVEFDRENGVDLFEAELDNGTDVRIDANSGAILGTDVRDAN